MAHRLQQPLPTRSISGFGKRNIPEFFDKDSREFALLLHGDSGVLLRDLPEHSIDVCVTSPPYWAQRGYDAESGLGQEDSPEAYATHLCEILDGLKHVLKETGSLWLNIGDTYQNKNLSGAPWRVALCLGTRGWILRNAVVWDKAKGYPCNAKDKLRNTYEMLFHFVLSRDYYYDLDAIRNAPGQPSYRNGHIVTPTGVSGTKYREQILTSPSLSSSERKAALKALDEALRKVEAGEMPDFRMIVRGCQRATHSDQPEFSGRAREMAEKGFYVLPYHRAGTKPGDVWKIIPEDEWRTDDHYAVFPTELCEIPVRATCPRGGVLIDPFAGTGTALVAAIREGRRAVGIDTSKRYLKIAEERLRPVIEQATQGNLF